MSESNAATLPVPKAAPPKPQRLPPWKVLLHNDRVNYMAYVVAAVTEIVRIPGSRRRSGCSKPTGRGSRCSW